MSTPEEGFGPPESPYGPPGQSPGGLDGPLPQGPPQGGSLGYMGVPSGYPVHALPGNMSQEVPSFGGEMGQNEPQAPHPGQFHYYPQHPVNFGPRFYPSAPPSHGPQPPHPTPPGFPYQGPPPNMETGQPQRFPGPIPALQRMPRPLGEQQRHMNPPMPMNGPMPQGVPIGQPMMQMSQQQNLMPVPAAPNTSFQPGMPPNHPNSPMRPPGIPPQQMPPHQMPPQQMPPPHMMPQPMPQPMPQQQARPQMPPQYMVPHQMPQQPMIHPQQQMHPQHPQPPEGLQQQHNAMLQMNPQQMLPQQVPPQQMPPQQMPPRQMPPQQMHPQHMMHHLQGVPPQVMHPQMPPQQVVPHPMESQQHISPHPNNPPGGQQTQPRMVHPQQVSLHHHLESQQPHQQMPTHQAPMQVSMSMPMSVPMSMPMSVPMSMPMSVAMSVPMSQAPMVQQELGMQPQFGEQGPQHQAPTENMPQQVPGHPDINSEQQQRHQMIPSMPMVHPQQVHPSQQIMQMQEIPPQMQQMAPPGIPSQHFIPQSMAQGVMPSHELKSGTSLDMPKNSVSNVPEFASSQTETPEHRMPSTSTVPTSKSEDRPEVPAEETPEDLNQVQPQSPNNVPREKETRTDSVMEMAANSVSSFQSSTPEASYTQATGFNAHPTVMPARPQQGPQMMLQPPPMHQPVSMQQAGQSMPMPPRLMMGSAGRPPAPLQRMVGPPQGGMVGPPQAVPIPGQPSFHSQMQFLPPSSGGVLGPRFPGPPMAVHPSAPQGSVQIPMSMSTPGQPVNMGMPQVQVAVVPNPASLEKKVAVPWGWKRLLLAETVVYFSPSGIQLKSLEEVQEYLSTEGTCKCGLQCPLAVQTSFDFDPKVSSEVQMPASQPGAPSQCKHQGSILALAQIQNNTGFAIRHNHNPTFNRARDGVKRSKVKKKKKPFSGVLVSQMLAAKEAEKQRINEIIAQQKALEAQKATSADNSPGTSRRNSTEAKITPVLPTQQPLMPPVPEVETPPVQPMESVKAVPSEEDVASPVCEEPLPPGTPPAHLTPRMVHPAMLSSRTMMNLGQVLSQSPDSPVATSPGPQGPEEKPRGFSLAEAMQAARKLNLEQEQREEQSLTSKEEEDSEMAVSDSEGGRLMISEMDAEEKTEEGSSPITQTVNSPEKEKGWDDTAKNIEIRRLSSTDEGNKVLEETFHSPEKDMKKNPLMNIFNIVSGMEAAPPPPEEPLPRGPQIPNPSALGALRPQLRGRKSRQYSTLPPLPHSPPPWVLGPPGQRPPLAQPPQGGPQQIVLAPQMVLQGQAPPPQQVMQLIQTVNGPMLVPMAAPQQQQMVQLQPQAGPVLSLGPRPLVPSTATGTANLPPPGSKIRLKKPNGPESAPTPVSMGAAPMVMSPSGNLVGFQNAATASSGAQMINIAQAGPGAGAQIVVGGQSMILMPQPQGIMYQQMPDGSLVQMQGQVLPQGQILMAGQGQVPPGAPNSQMIVAPGSLVQGLAPVPQGPNRQLLSVAPSNPPRKRQSAKKVRPKKKVKSAEDREDAEQDETDTSFEEPQPSTSKSLSPRSSIQSNKVDSSGLNATPPHQKDAADFEQLREKSPESEVEFRDLLDTTGDGDEREEDRAETSASNVSFVEEKIVISDDDESAVEEEQQSRSKFVTSSSKKKKKRKKKAARESHSSRSRSGERGSPGESPVVPPEPRDFRVGDLVWGPAHGFPSWPGKLVRGSGERAEGKVWVCWFGTRDLSEVEGHRLKTLSEGLEAHHRERKKSRRGRKMNTSLEKAIQEAMAELD